jgi:HEAT repeat protein
MRRILLIVLLIALSGCGGAPPKMAGDKWAEALRDPSAQVRRKAAFTLGNIGLSDPAALPALIGALRDPDAGVRREAILALSKGGAAVKAAVPALQDLRRHDPDPGVRNYAGRAVEKIQAGG